MSEGDVLLCHSADGGELVVESGKIQYTKDLRTAIYLSLFGGNEDDDGREDSGNTWWGNVIEPDPVKKYVSQTQYLLKSMPATTANLLRLSDAVNGDLSWLTDTKRVEELNAVISLPALNSVSIEIQLLIDGTTYQYTLTTNWEQN